MGIIQMIKAWWILRTAKKEIENMEKQGKKWYESVTIVANAILALLTVVPGVDLWVAAHPAVAAIIAAVTNIGLRLKTAEPIK